MEPLRSDENNPHSPVSTSFDEQTGIILAHLDKVDFDFVDVPVRYQGKTFQPKGELHVTLVSQDAGAILKHLVTHPEDADEIQDLVITADFSFIKLSEFYHVVERPGVETIIQMVDVPGLRTFFKDLSRLVGQGFLVPPTHVTLYTRGTEKGIGLPDQQTFQQLTQTAIHPGEVQPAEEWTTPGAEQGLA